MDSVSNSLVCAVIVTHNPDQDVKYRAQGVLCQVGGIIVVDNGSTEQAREWLFDAERSLGLKVILNEKNLGIGAALLQGMKWADENGFSWLLTLDQDSRPASDMVQKLFQALEDGPLEPPIAVISSVAVHDDVRRNATFLRPRRGVFYIREECKAANMMDVSITLSSGSLYKIDTLYELGGFREDFFIDYVDTEYCLRAQTKGYRIGVACNARLEHRLGARVERRVGPLRFFPTFHSPIRWYYISRNRIPMLRMYALKFPHWFSFEIVSSVYIFFRMLLFEDHRLKKLKAIFYGTLDGLRGRMGEISPEIAIKLLVPDAQQSGQR